MSHCDDANCPICRFREAIAALAAARRDLEVTEDALKRSHDAHIECQGELEEARELLRQAVAALQTTVLVQPQHRIAAFLARTAREEKP